MKRPEGPVQTILDLSTAHMPSSDPDTRQLRRVNHEYGMIIFVCAWAVDDEPEWLKPILLAARENNCILINFDRDAEEAAEFSTFEW